MIFFPLPLPFPIWFTDTEYVEVEAKPPKPPYVVPEADNTCRVILAPFGKTGGSVYCTVHRSYHVKGIEP